VRNLGDRPPRQLALAVEGGVEQRDVDAREARLDRPPVRGVPALPLVDVGQIEQRASRPPDLEAEGVGVLLPVGDEEGRDGEPGGELDRTLGLEGARLDLAQAHELLPGGVALEEGDHARRAVDRDAVGAVDLAAELGEAEVVADMRVGEEDAVEDPRAALRDRARWSDFVGALELEREIGGGVDQPAPSGARVDDQQRGHQPAQRRIAARREIGRRAPAEVGDAAVLGGAEDEHEGSGALGARGAAERRAERERGGERERDQRKPGQRSAGRREPRPHARSLS